MDGIFFDRLGLLQPAKILSLSIEDFQALFVSNHHREILFQKLLEYNQNLSTLIQEPFEQWVDGSFISTKSAPNDIDILSFIPHDVYDKYRHEIDLNYRGKALKLSGLDAHLLEVYPTNHSNAFFTSSDKAYWRNLFGYTRYNRNRKRTPKGIVQLIIRK